MRARCGGRVVSCLLRASWYMELIVVGSRVVGKVCFVSVSTERTWKSLTVKDKLLGGKETDKVEASLEARSRDRRHAVTFEGFT